MSKTLNECIVPMYPTIQALDVDTLEPGEHKFWFAVATDAIGHPQTLPVRVFKGSKPGKRIVITAGIHGDEQNGILTAQKLARVLENQTITGCITIVPTVNLSGIARHSRDFHSAAPDSSSANLNRIFPGSLTEMMLIVTPTAFGKTYFSPMRIWLSIFIHKPVVQRILCMPLRITDWMIRLRWQG